MKSALWAVVLGLTCLSGTASARSAVRYQHAGWLVPSQATQGLLGQRPMLLDQMTREQLQREKERLENETPSLVGPIVLTSLSGGSLLAGVYYFVGSFIPAYNLGYSTVWLVLGLVAMSAGILCGVIGIIWLVARINERATYKDRVAAVESRLDAIYAPGGAPEHSQPPMMVPPPPPPGAPPPPPPPPSSLGEVPPPSMVVAEF